MWARQRNVMLDRRNETIPGSPYLERAIGQNKFKEINQWYTGDSEQ